MKLRVKPSVKIKTSKETFDKLTLSSHYNFTKNQRKILTILSKGTKNAYNHYLFCINFYYKFKQQIYKDIYNDKIITNNINDNINDNIKLNIRKYYDYYSHNYNLLKKNNELIYNYIKRKKPFVTNDNYKTNLVNFMTKCMHIKDIEFDESNYILVYQSIIEKILQSFYHKNYYLTKNELVNKKQLTITDNKFIQHVKNENQLNFYNTSNYRELLKEIYPKILSEQTLIRNLAYHTFTDSTITSDLTIGAMDRAWNSFQSYWALKQKNIPCNKPKYLDKNGLYTLSFYGKTKKEINGTIKLSVGKYITNNILDIIGTNSKFELIINIPKQLKDKTIKLIEINPLYNGHSFKLNFIYNIPKQNKPEIKHFSIDEMISIDLGIVNLATIYDPSGKQHIIKGTHLIARNNYFNKQLSKLQSIAKKVNNTNYTKQMYKLLIKRNNQINAYFNQIVATLYKKYKDKKVIIIGYNDGWKTNINIGKSNNRTFYQIPYRRFIYKLFRKFKNANVVEIEESYTSKCDALSFEEILRHDKYSGKRINRGLFQSGTGRILNADLNGAINIMRKYCTKNKIIFNRITGINLENPIKCQIVL